MDGLLTADNLPVIIGIVLAPHVVNWFRELLKTFQAWRKGATDKEKNIILATVTQLEKCHQELETVEDERDAYRRQVGRRDFLLLKAGIEPPNDGSGHGVDDRSV